MHLSTLDAACTAHMAHGAMALDDPLTEALYQQCSAPDGAQPATTADTGLTPAQRAALADAERDPWLWRLAGGAVLLGVCTGALTAADMADALLGWLA